MTSLGIVIPTYNEAANVAPLLNSIKKHTRKIKGTRFLITIVDDNSPDGTSRIVKKIAKNINNSNFKISVLDRIEKNGYGKACIEGMENVINKRVDLVMSMDADLSHNPKYIKNFLNASREHDLIIGSRYVLGGSTPDWPLLRKTLSRYGNYYARLFLNNEISDYTGGFNLYSTRLLQDTGLHNIKSNGYGFLIELKYKASMKAKSIYQVPIVFHDRQHGKSKIPKSTLIKNLFLVPKLRVQPKDK